MDDYFEHDENNGGDEGDEQVFDEYEFDQDYYVDDYAGQDAEINDIEGKQGDKEEEDENDILEETPEIEFEQTMQSVFNPKIKRTSRIARMSKYEYSAIYGKLSEYISTSKLSIPDGLLEHPEVLSGDAFRIARCWIENRKQFPIPLEVDRKLFGNVNEKISINDLRTDEYYEFDDDNTDKHRFHYNFRAEPYNNCA